MDIVFLFNSNHSDLGTLYEYAVMEKILGANVFQHAQRNMRVSIGDIVIDTDIQKLAKLRGCSIADVYLHLYSPNRFDKLLMSRLRETFH